MLRQRKKDYLQRIIEEFFAKLQELIANDSRQDTHAKKLILSDCFDFFFVNFDVKGSEEVKDIIEKIGDTELLEQYAKLLVVDYQLADTRNKESLLNALSIVEYLQDTNTVYSWERIVIREDALLLLDEETAF